MSDITRRMFRYVVPIDDRHHEIALTGDPVAVGQQAFDAVEFWAEHIQPHGHPLPPNARWVGTCPRTPDGLVWHLYEMNFAAAAIVAELEAGRA